MERNKLIKTLRKCAKASADVCVDCDYYDREPWCHAALVSDAADAIEKLSKQKTTILLKPNDKRPLHECAVCGWYFSDGDVKDFNYCPCCGGKIEKDDETIQDALKEMRTE